MQASGFIPGIGPAATAAATYIPPTGQPSVVPTPTMAPTPAMPQASTAPTMEWLQTVCAAARAMQSRRVADTDRVVHFEDILRGAAGSEEQQAALAMLQQPLHSTRNSASNGATLVYVDDGGIAPAQVFNAWRQLSLHNMTVTVRATSTGTKRKINADPDNMMAADEGTTRKTQKKTTAPVRKYGDCPGPMPAGWVLVRRDVDDPSKHNKRYKSPEGQIFASYGQAQQHWERVGSTVLVDTIPPVSLVPYVAPAAVVEEAACGAAQIAYGGLEDPDGEVDVVLPLDSDLVGERKYLPDAYIGASQVSRPWWSLDHVRRGTPIIHQPTGTILKTVMAVRQSIKRRNLQLQYLPSSVDFGNMLDWFCELARSDVSPAVQPNIVEHTSPAAYDGQEVLAEGVARVQAVLCEHARAGVGECVQTGGGQVH